MIDSNLVDHINSVNIDLVANALSSHAKINRMKHILISYDSSIVAKDTAKTLTSLVNAYSRTNDLAEMTNDNLPSSLVSYATRNYSYSLGCHVVADKLDSSKLRFKLYDYLGRRISDSDYDSLSTKHLASETRFMLGKVSYLNYMDIFKDYAKSILNEDHYDLTGLHILYQSESSSNQTFLPNLCRLRGAEVDIISDSINKDDLMELASLSSTYYHLVLATDNDLNLTLVALPDTAKLNNSYKEVSLSELVESLACNKLVGHEDKLVAASITSTSSLDTIADKTSNTIVRTGLSYKSLADVMLDSPSSLILGVADEGCIFTETCLDNDTIRLALEVANLCNKIPSLDDCLYIASKESYWRYQSTSKINFLSGDLVLETTDYRKPNRYLSTECSATGFRVGKSLGHSFVINLIKTINGDNLISAYANKSMMTRDEFFSTLNKLNLYNKGE